jgi:SAM-dependent methyltransferase
LLKERLREIIFGGNGSHNLDFAQPHLPEANGYSNGHAAPAVEGWERHSHGLEQFFAGLGGEAGLSILDMGEINQTRVSFITDLGHRMYSEDFLRAMDGFFGEHPDAGSDPRRVEAFLAYTLTFPPGKFDGVLVWDTLEYLSRPMLAAVIERLHRILRPRGCLLALFHTDEKSASVPLYSFRIADARTLILRPKGRRRPAQSFNNRSIEKLFHDFHSVKFFLTRDQLREVIARA